MKSCSTLGLNCMIYDFMRLILFFDLPVATKKDRHNYAVFRKYLIKQGYKMIQFSIYSKIFSNLDAVNNHIKILKKNLPQDGSIRAMVVTEKQYSRMLILVGSKTFFEEQENMDTLIEL